MIPVRIAARLDATGVSGVRWVLVDAAEGGVQADTAEAVDDAAAVVAQRSPRSRLLWLLRFALLVGGLALAWAATQATITGQARGPQASVAAPHAVPDLAVPQDAVTTPATDGPADFTVITFAAPAAADDPQAEGHRAAHGDGAATP